MTDRFNRPSETPADQGGDSLTKALRDLRNAADRVERFAKNLRTNDPARTWEPGDPECPRCRGAGHRWNANGGIEIACECTLPPLEDELDLELDDQPGPVVPPAGGWIERIRGTLRAPKARAESIRGER